MLIKLKRIVSNKNETLGMFIINDEYECMSLEDQKQDVKVYGETRIPPGTYEIKFRREGRMHVKYSNRFPTFHQGMLHIQNIPNFEWVYIHIGNDDDDTLGCPLVGCVPNKSKDGTITLQNSTDAYTRLYKKVSEALLNNEKVYIEIKDLD